MCRVFCNSIVRLVVLGFLAMQVPPSFYEGRASRPPLKSVRIWTVVSIFLTRPAARLPRRFPPSRAPFLHQSRPGLCLLGGAEVHFRSCFAPSRLAHSLDSKSHPRKQVRAAAHFQA